MPREKKEAIDLKHPCFEASPYMEVIQGSVYTVTGHCSV